MLSCTKNRLSHTAAKKDRMSTTLSLFLLALPAVLTSANTNISVARPNLFMTLIDDLGYHNTGFHNPQQISPHMDQLVKDGVLLEAHYTFQFCSPTRSSFLSGRLPLHVNQKQPDNGATAGGIDLRMTLISQKLKLANYTTHMIGKGHIGAHATANLPINRGFDR